MERGSTSYKFEEEYVQPTQSTLQIQRNISNSMYNLNHALSKNVQNIIESERALLVEQALDQQDFQINKTDDDSLSDEISEDPLNKSKEYSNIEEYMQKRLNLIQTTRKDHFSNEIELKKVEISAEKKLMHLRDQLFSQDPSIVTGFYYDKYKKLQQSKLYEALNEMPKPAVHHVHLTAASPIDFLIKLTYYDYVYFNERANLFKVSKKGITESGYQKTTTLRKYWSKAEEFDNYLKNLILLNRESACCIESHPIWEAFQPKFLLTCDLYNYEEFFEKILLKVCKVFIKQMVSVLELRHIFGMIIDDDGKPITPDQEILIFERVLAKVQRDFPLFQIKIIVCSLKIIGKDHNEKMIRAVQDQQKKCNLIAGFDMVNEEDATPSIKEFVSQILEDQNKCNFPVILHAGESIDRHNENLVDAILLGTKRIGHGFNLALHPHLQEIVKKEQICIECCPTSNMVLGYTLDLRCHPARAFLHQGIPVSISPDDPGFFDAEGVTLDYVYAFMAWELNLADLKKLCLNSLDYSVIPDAEKERLRPFFEYKWKKFLEYVNSKY